MSIKDLLPKMFTKRKVALVLGGGSARGFAHIGVLKVLQREKLNFDLIVGTSIGAFIGAFYALGKDMAVAEKMASSFNAMENLDFSMPPSMGLVKGDKIYGIIKQFLGDNRFADTKIPMAVVTCDIENGKEVVFTEGPLAEAVHASCSYPGIVVPRRINDQLLVDGGIINTVPVSVARSMGADVIIAVDVGFCVQVGRIKSVFGVILQAFQITGEELNRYQSMHAHVIIKPDLGSVTQLDFESSKITIQKGEIAALEQLKKIKRKLGRR